MTKRKEEKRMIRLAIFDLDGTLVNSLGDLADVCNRGLHALGYPMHPEVAYRRFVGNGVRKLCERCAPKGGDVDRLYAYFNEEYPRHCMDRTHPYEGISALLEALSKENIALAVASNKTDAFSKSIVTHFFGQERFAVIAGKTADRPTKPDPAIIRGILNALCVAPQEAVMLGDSDVDMHTAQNAGIHALGCAWGFRSEEELRQSGAEQIAHCPQEVAALIHTF